MPSETRKPHVWSTDGYSGGLQEMRKTDHVTAGHHHDNHLTELSLGKVVHCTELENCCGISGGATIEHGVADEWRVTSD
ncbi:hypothetical protein ElyMa_006519100 [Elysia marginata]|uniref:Uncharacterized protein n=1 Tax=Elysia marginata TaxID=1093978 RepID=A0AAV4I8J4_9GAST|nr:hypothetical protein ElyMa_006519100 [Elysia marginata]